MSVTVKNNEKEWTAELSEEEKMYVELLDGYFQFRSPLPPHGDCLATIEDCLTTADIVDDLTDMAPVPQSLVYKYMQHNGYGFKTLRDGRVKWAIWRMP